MKKVIKYIILAIVVFTAAFFYSFVKKTGVVKADNTIDCKGYKMSAVRLAFDSVEEDEGEVTVVIMEDGNELRQVTKNVTELSKDGYTKFSFDKFKISKDKKYTVNLKTNTEKIKLKANELIKYDYIGFRLETMIVFVICIAYLIGLSKTLSFIFRK